MLYIIYIYYYLIQKDTSFQRFIFGDPFFWKKKYYVWLVSVWVARCFYFRVWRPRCYYWIWRPRSCYYRVRRPSCHRIWRPRPCYYRIRRPSIYRIRRSSCYRIWRPRRDWFRRLPLGTLWTNVRISAKVVDISWRWRVRRSRRPRCYYWIWRSRCPRCYYWIWRSRCPRYYRVRRPSCHRIWWSCWSGDGQPAVSGHPERRSGIELQDDHCDEAVSVQVSRGASA